MTTTLPAIPDGLRGRLAHLGPDGVRWFEELPDLTAAAASEWHVELGYGLDVPTASLVVRGRRRGHPVVLKLCPPQGNFDRELAVLTAARGRGYVQVLESDAARRALLLEPLGASFNADGRQERDGGYVVRHLITASLKQAWTVPATALPGHEPGEHPAERLRADIVARRQHYDATEGRRAVDRALAYTEHRLADRDPEREVVVHGNPRPWNLRAVPVPRVGAETGHVFVAPLGLRCEREYDLGAILLESHAWMLSAEDPVVLARRWCAELAEASGCDAEVIWQWSYVQRVAQGLALLDGPDQLLGLSQLHTALTLISRGRG